MKKPAPTKSKKRVAKISPRHTPDPGAVNLARVRQQIHDLVGSEAIGMVEATISAAGDGQYGAMKYLFEMVGLFPATAEDPTDGDEVLARALLVHLGLPETPGLERTVTKGI